MAFRSDIAIDWSTSPRIITVLSPSVELTIQDLVDTVRDLEDELPNMAYDKIVDATGKEPLGGGNAVGITATLRNAQVGFEARPGPSFTTCNVLGGNLTATDAVGDDLDPIQTTAFVQVVRTSSSSATLSSQTALEAAVALVAQLLESEQGADPVTGQFIWFEDDGVTVAKSAPAWEDFAETQQYRGQGIERRGKAT